MDAGIIAAAQTAVANPLPTSWLGRADAPLAPPSWAGANALTSTQIRNLLAQISYDQSGWNYNLIGSNNRLGRYQFETAVLEQYGLLAAGSNTAYGTDCVNYRHCWQQVAIQNNTNSYANYLYDVTSLNGFLTGVATQEHLAYQFILDLDHKLGVIDAVVAEDSTDVVAGMIYVAWALGVDSAKIWRYTNTGAGVEYFNNGRYAIAVLGQ